MAWAGSAKLPALYFRGCDLTAEWLPAKEHVRVQLLATAPISYAAHQLVQQSLQNSVCLGQHQSGVPISNGAVAEK